MNNHKNVLVRGSLSYCIACGNDNDHVKNPCEFMQVVREYISKQHSKGQHSSCHPNGCIKTTRSYA